MGYALRGLRVASYLAAALGLLLILGAILNNALFFYGIRLLFIGVVGIGATSLLRDRYLDGEEEEEYRSLLPAPQIKAPKPSQVKIPKLPLDAILGSISGFIGVLVGGFAAEVQLSMQSSEAGSESWGYIFLALICCGYPLIGALLGVVSASIVLLNLKHFPKAVHHPEIVALLVGFVIGVLAGIAPFIVINWVDKIYWQ